MKFLVLIPDGAADRPVDSLGGKTPLEAARTPNMDRLVKEGETGLVRTVPARMDPGSDVANLSLFGYDPGRVYTGRAPLEAASLGIELADDDVALRCNLVSTGGKSPEDPGAVMEDYSAGHISTGEGRRIIEDFRRSEGFREHFRSGLEFFPGVGYRHLLVWRNGRDGTNLTPPHDILGQEVGPHLPTGEGGDLLRRLMGASADFLGTHPVNSARREKGLPTADTFWFWGAGRKPSLPTLRELTGLSGAVISAVDLVNGIGALAGIERISVPGATGYVDTDYGAKARFALEALGRHDIVFVHIEAPDEAGHQGDAALKVRAIESVDGDFLGVVLEGVKNLGGIRVLVAPDHPTPLAMRTHTADPVPFLISPASAGTAPRERFDERTAGSTGLVVEEGHRLLGRLLGRP